jgi:hypothetical protein
MPASCIRLIARASALVSTGSSDRSPRTHRILGHFRSDEIKAMITAYESALTDLGITDRNNPLTELIAKSIVNVTATGERDLEKIRSVR